MSIELVVTEEAERDIAEAVAWYEERRSGLGEDFLTSLDASLQGLLRMPEMHPVAYKTFRRALIRRFPYAIFYEFESLQVMIYSVFHTARDPQKWRQRLN
ncbi:MAG: type II toxin-antitoxin system RelE/ParE family toxin [Planctomycetota bacterium]|nr:type II toxin-antitoxin system RelE/ParE family toxin [Planctomycetota bacterium]MDA0921035.1 type II toxin-antitoxin system RelE/ParE family toxin [Planctomycetota bacterium]MDA1160007.1 type II toxin-antitoxin system RelE/ParE family toxin [Planctomycetota bacterium]